MGIKYQVNEEFFDKWSLHMAYVLGYLYADGSLEDASYLRGKYIRVTSVEKSIILKIKRWLHSKHKITVDPSIWPNGKPKYCLRIGSHKLYAALSKLGLYPNKSLTIKFPNIVGRYLKDFVRGYLDGDGCVYLERAKGKTQKLIIKKLCVIFTCGSKDFLDGLSSVLIKTAGVHHSKVYTGHRAFQLRYTTSDSIKLFKYLYRKVLPGLYFKRKTMPFLRYFQLRPSKQDRKIKKLIEHLSGHVVK